MSFSLWQTAVKRIRKRMAGLSFMYKKLRLHQLNDFFLPLSVREQKGIYFYRIYHYNEEIGQFIYQYLIEAKRQGIVIQEKIPNPNEKQLAFYQEIMGMEFEPNKTFIDCALIKWLPRLNEIQRSNVVESILHTLEKMGEDGKSKDIQRNAYIKFMCWLYYKFERILIQLGQEKLPKILYEGEITKYELDILSILGDAGCDILLIEKNGDDPYKKADPKMERSFGLERDIKEPFPKDFSIACMEQKIQRENRFSMLYHEEELKIISTNTWLTGEIFADSLKEPKERGINDNYCYNLFVRLTGVEDKLNYAKELFQWKKQLEDRGRKVFILSELLPPDNQEIQKVHPNQYQTVDEMILDLASRLKSTGCHRLDQQMKKTFVVFLLEEEKKREGNLNKLKNEAVYLICWLNRYSNKLTDGKDTSISTFIYFGVCKSEMEALFFRFLSWLFVDVFLINPDQNKKCVLTDRRLFEKCYEGSLELLSFPESVQDISTGTVAFQAEKELNSLLYQDTGLYRNNQYKKAQTLLLQTMCEEVYLLWDQELKYRPSFEVLGEEVLLPVLGAKILGVKNQDTNAYFNEIQKLMTEDTTLFLPEDKRSYDLTIRSYATQLIRNGKLDRNKIKACKEYAYGIYREEVQEYILDKIQELIDAKLIQGTFVNGMEYTILAVGLSLDGEWMKKIQKFDFTKKNPKLLMMAFSDKDYSLEDSILVALLSKIGFDVVLFIPTGFRILERYYTKPLFVEHQEGEYMFDLPMPMMKQTIKDTILKSNTIFKRIFKRG